MIPLSRQGSRRRAGGAPLLVLAALVAALSAGPLAASAGEPRGKRAQAKAEFEKGQLHYRLGRFEEALQAYSRAYELFRAPALLFNIGQCHKNLQHHERAIFFFEGYLREETNPEKRALAQELIAASRAQLEREHNEPPKMDPIVGPAPSVGEPRPAATPPPPVPPPVAVVEAPAPPPAAPVLITAPDQEPPAEEQPLHRTWWFWAAVGGAAAVATGAAVYYGFPKDTVPMGSVGTLDRRQ